MKNAKNTWGGARNYAKGTGLRQSLTCRVDPLTLERLEELSTELGISKGKVLDLIISRYGSLSKDEQ